MSAELQPVPTSSRFRPWPRRCRASVFITDAEVGSSTSILLEPVHRPSAEQTLAGAGPTRSIRTTRPPRWRPGARRGATTGPSIPSALPFGGGRLAMGALAGRAIRSPSAEIIAGSASTAISTKRRRSEEEKPAAAGAVRPWCARRRPRLRAGRNRRPPRLPTRPGANSSARPWTILRTGAGPWPSSRLSVARSPRLGRCVRRPSPLTSRPVNGASLQSYRWVQAHVVPVMAADGSVREWIGALTDIHEKKVRRDQHTPGAGVGSTGFATPGVVRSLSVQTARTPAMSTTSCSVRRRLTARHAHGLLPARRRDRSTWSTWCTPSCSRFENQHAQPFKIRGRPRDRGSTSATICPWLPRAGDQCEQVRRP